MKIALYNVTTTVTHGGVETYVWEMARELAERGHDVHVIGGEGSVRREIEGVKVLTFPFRDRKSFPGLGSRYRKFAERMSFANYALPFMKKERYDFVLILKPYDMPWAWQLKRSWGKCRAVMCSQGTDFFPGDRWFAKKIDGFTTCSRFNGGRIEAHYHLPAEVIYNGFNEKMFRPLSPDSELRKQLGIGEDEQVIMYAGRLVKLKGVHYLLDAFGSLRERASLRLVIIGDGPEREPLREKAVALGVQDRVLFAGFVPNQ
ncbi:MAG: glycosyltransferase, partial [Nitrospirota bacterium]|nr:glycosyltransferase [Nitrospirota bacterium]